MLRDEKMKAIWCIPALHFYDFFQTQTLKLFKNLWQFCTVECVANNIAPSDMNFSFSKISRGINEKFVLRSYADLSMIDLE